MKTPLSALAIVTFIALVTSLSARAQILTASVYLASEDQVLTTGTEVWGGDDTGGNAVLQNGVTFGNGYQNGQGYYGSQIPGYGDVRVRTDGAYRGDYTAEGAFSDGSLNLALQYDSTGSYGQYYVTGLVPGSTYVLQMFATLTSNGYTDGGASGSETVTDDTPGGTDASAVLDWGQAVAGVGTGTYFITDTFTANASGDEYLDLSNIAGAPVQIGATEIRDLVPEPSTYALMLLGSAGLVFLAVRRRRLA